MRAPIQVIPVSAILLIASVREAKPVPPVDDHVPYPSSSKMVTVKTWPRRRSRRSISRLPQLSTETAIEKRYSGEIDRIEFGDPETATRPGRSHFIGKWEVGEGNGGKFYITLDSDGDARKTLGPPHGTWTLVDGEARIAWDDGWHDAIRKVGAKHEKLAYEPGKTFGDPPSNVTTAVNTEHKTI